MLPLRRLPGDYEVTTGCAKTSSSFPASHKCWDVLGTSYSPPPRGHLLQLRRTFLASIRCSGASPGLLDATIAFLVRSWSGRTPPLPSPRSGSSGRRATRAPPLSVVAGAAPMTIWSQRRHHLVPRDALHPVRAPARPSSRGIDAAVVDLATMAMGDVIHDVTSGPLSAFLFLINDFFVFVKCLTCGTRC